MKFRIPCCPSPHATSSRGASPPSSLPPLEFKHKYHPLSARGCRLLGSLLSLEVENDFYVRERMPEMRKKRKDRGTRGSMSAKDAKTFRIRKIRKPFGSERYENLSDENPKIRKPVCIYNTQYHSAFCSCSNNKPSIHRPP